MRLVAIYIKEHFLFSEPQTINFGGKYIYSFSESESVLLITRFENENFIEGFWGENLSLVSAVVGANGSGKTSVLEIINQSYRKRNKSLFIYEDLKENISYYENRIADFDENESMIVKSKIRVSKPYFNLEELSVSIEKLYFSNAFDEKVLDFYSPLDNNAKSNKMPLSTIFSNNLLKEVIFLQSKTSDVIKSIYEDFPRYDNVSISANKLYKRDLENLYLGSNLGYTNIIEKFRSDVKWEIERIEEKIIDVTYKNQIDELERYLKFQNLLIYITEKDRLFELFEIILNNVVNDKPITNDFFKIFANKNFKIEELKKEEKQQLLGLVNYLKQFSVTEVLRELWNKYPNVKDNQFSHLVHSGKNLINNLEINILSLIALNDTFQINGLQGSYDVDKILKETDFTKMMNKFLEKYLIQKHKTLYKIIINKLEGDLDILNHQKKIIEIIKSDKFSKEGGTETIEPKQRMIEDIEGFVSIMEFYNYIKEVAKKDQSAIDLNVKNSNSLVILNTIFDKYEKVKIYFSKVSLLDTDIIQFKVDKNLSFGQKSLLNLYSVFYDFTFGNDFIKKNENYLILLDEGDLGYHALWKKKYIDAITKTLPIIFNKLTPKVYDGKRYKNAEIEYPNIQIILTTHDPLTLSDIPNNNIVYLDKKEGKTIILTDNEKPQKSFGANITDLLADSFFIEDGLIGDFAKGKINEVIKFLKNEESKIKTKKEAKQIIEIIDEPLMKRKLSEMYDELFNDDMELKQLQKEKNNLESRIQRLINKKKL